ncbi:hypothetical protein KP509_29G039800 [Ceratopteris richardii]|uniref:PRONE domain-containing protein n=1 Tax=Ceratopteris richardii TaxID=49495 RepID=A0A8T2R819_CERRI|nr:hypothetical protein KP509_29G039800 [Ceratopteris richardii]
MERQPSAGSSISLSSWGSDLPEEKQQFHASYDGFNFSCHPSHVDACIMQEENIAVCFADTGPGNDYAAARHQYVSSFRRSLESEIFVNDKASTFLTSIVNSSDSLLSKRVSLSHHDKEWLSVVLMMKERFAKLLLGDDFSGGSKASNTALTISNAIGKLSVSIFGELWRLEPLPYESKLRWRREMEWLVSPCDYIVELAPCSRSLDDGTTTESNPVLISRPRSDVCIGLPALRKLDALLLETLESFRETEFWYVESVQDNPSNGAACDAENYKAWIPIAKVPCCGLSEKARKELSHQREAANQILKAAKSINEHVLSEMDIPESYWKNLPKSSKKVMEDTQLRIITSEYCCFETLLSTLNHPSHQALLNLADRLETLVHVWKSKISSRLKQALHSDGTACRAAPTWAMSRESSLKKVTEKKLYVERAENLLMELRQRSPGLLQTSLDQSKVQLNKDVGYAILESYSRVLVNIATRIQTRIGEVVAADKDAILSRLEFSKANSSSARIPNAAEADTSTSIEGLNLEHDNSRCHRRSLTDGLAHLSVQLERILGDHR